MFKQARIKRWLVVAVTVAAAGFPSVAAAMPAQDPPAQSSSAYDIAISTPSSNSSTSSGFEWGDAGIGAAGLAVLMGTGAAATISMRRRRVRRVVTG